MNSIIWHHATVTRQRRNLQNKHKSVVVWFTGLSGSGKSTLAHAIEEELHQKGCRTIVLDGDNIRHGLSKDLSFDNKSRQENIRRISEVAKLFVEAGVIVLTAFISPFKVDRQSAKHLIGEQDFIQVYVDCPLNVCEKRDVKGIYKKARNNKIANFTGISSPYEKPDNPHVIVNTEEEDLQESVNKVVSFLKNKGIIDYAS